MPPLERPDGAASEASPVEPFPPPLARLLLPLVAWFENRIVEICAEAGFTDVRRAHTRVFANVPARGIRLTELANKAGISKQAMGELVDDLVAKDYFTKEADPSDRRAKLILWAERGHQIHRATLGAFDRIEAQIAAVVGTTEIETLSNTLLQIMNDVVLTPSEPPTGPRT